METKKAHSADLEHKRTTAFLLGLVFVLSTLYVALEYTTHDDGPATVEQLLDDLVQDMEMLPALEQQEMAAAAPVLQQQPVTQQVKAVEESSKLEKAVELNELRLVSEGDAQATQAEEARPLAPVAVDENDNPLNFRIVEQLPEFPGGMVALMKWLTKNLRYPAQAQRQKIQGKVVVSFIVNKDGTIADAKVAQSVDPSLDREAMRVVRMMPPWKPGIHNNEPCRTMFVIPIVFKL